MNDLVQVFSPLCLFALLLTLVSAPVYAVQFFRKHRGVRIRISR